MLLNNFHSNDPTRLFILILLIPVLFAFSWGIEPAQDQGTGMPFYNFLITVLNGNFWGHLVVRAVLIALCAIQLSILISKLGLLDRHTHIPALFFTLMICSLLSMQVLNPMLSGLPFVLWALRNSWSTTSEHGSLSPHFDAGILIGIASMFYFPFVLLLPAIWVSTAFLRTFRWREWLFPVLGIGFIHLLVHSSYFLLGAQMPSTLGLQEWAFDLGGRELTWVTLAFLCFTILLFLWSFYWFAKMYQKSKMRRKNLLKSTVGLTFFLMLIFLLSGFKSEQYRFTILALPIAIFLSFLFFGLYEKKRWLANSVFYLWLAILLLSLWSERSM